MSYKRVYKTSVLQVNKITKWGIELRQPINLATKIPRLQNKSQTVTAEKQKKKKSNLWQQISLQKQKSTCGELPNSWERYKQ